LRRRHEALEAGRYRRGRDARRRAAARACELPGPRRRERARAVEDADDRRRTVPRGRRRRRALRVSASRRATRAVAARARQRRAGGEGPALGPRPVPDSRRGGHLRQAGSAGARRRRPRAAAARKSWLRLAASCPTAPPLPELTGTWVELVPASASAFAVQEERIRFDDWTSLCELLASHAPQTLAAFGFPEQQRKVIESFVSAAETADLAALPPAQRELLRPILRRPSRLGVTDPVRAANAAARLVTVRHEPELPEVYPRRRISAELRDLPSASLIHSDQALVTRVLRDL